MNGRVLKAGSAWLIAALVVFGFPQWAVAKDYLLTGTKPGNLILIDPAARKVVKEFPIPNSAPGPLTIVPSPDGQVAYVICNRWESVVGINLDSGAQVFRADFSKGDVRTKAMFAMDVSPDGKELVVFLSPVKLGLGEYEAQDTYVAVFDTSSGVGAEPIRTFPAPRRTALLFYSTDGSKLYSASWDISVHDPKTGEIVKVHKVQNWERANRTPPEVLAVWPQFEAANMFSTPYFTVHTDKAPDDYSAYQFGMLTLDLDTDELVMKEYEPFSTIIFSTTVNPVRKNEVYGVYTTLSKIDMDKPALVKRINLDHTYYDVNVSSDGEELYVGGTMSDIAVYSTADLSKLGNIQLPGGADMALASMRLIQR